MAALHRNAIFLVVCTAVAACTDHRPATITSPVIPGISLAQSLSPRADGDDTEAIIDAINQACATDKQVYLGPGQYRVSRKIEIPCDGIQISGAGKSATVIELGPDHHEDAFVAKQRSQLVFRDFSVTKPADGFFNLYSVRVSSSRHVLVERIHAHNLGIFASDGGPDRFHPVHSEHVTVRNSGGIGQCSVLDCDSLDPNSGIVIGYTKHATVSEDTARFYTSGIQWWGGDAKDPYSTDAARAAYVRDVYGVNIERSHVTDVENGIWGSRGDSVRVVNNRVERCGDVCLDAEGSRDVLFLDNQAGNSRGGGVLAAYDYSTDVRFVWNQVWQDDGWDAPLFWLHNQEQQTSGVSVWVHNNRFEKFGSQVGVVTKEASGYANFSNNTLHNVVVDMAGNNNGGVYMNGNTLTFTLNTGGRPAIRMGRNYAFNGGPAAPVNGPWELEVGGNHITSAVAQSAPGIQVEQTLGSATIDSYIHLNKIIGFVPSIKLLYDNPKTRNFRVESNQLSSDVDRCGGNVTCVNNTRL